MKKNKILTILRALDLRIKEVQDFQTGVTYFYVYKRGIRTPIGGFVNRLPSEIKLRKYLLGQLQFENIKLNGRF